MGIESMGGLKNPNVWDLSHLEIINVVARLLGG
jgi:hypothetical protein